MFLGMSEARIELFGKLWAARGGEVLASTTFGTNIYKSLIIISIQFVDEKRVTHIVCEKRFSEKECKQLVLSLNVSHI